MSRSRAAASVPALDRFLADAGKALARGDAVRARTLAERMRTQTDAPEAVFVLALAAALEGDVAGTAALAVQAFDAAPDRREPADLAAMAYAEAGLLQDALFYGKLGAVLPPSSLAPLLPPERTDFARALSTIVADPLLKRAARAMGEGRWSVAEHWFRQHLAFDPDCRDAWVGAAVTILRQGRVHAAADLLRAARGRLPDDADIASLLGRCAALLGRHDWSRACHDGAVDAAPGDPVPAADRLLDRLVDPRADGAGIAAESRAWGLRFGRGDDASRAEALARVAPPRLTVGLIVAGCGETDDVRAVARILGHRDADRFGVVAFGHGSLAEDRNAGFRTCAEVWRDVAHCDPLTFAHMIGAEGVDVVLDLAGFAAPRLLSAFGGRVAPVQAAWLGSPYGTGLAGMDYLLGDAFVDQAPTPDRVCETLVRLDLGCVPLLPARRQSVPAPVPVGFEEGEILFAADVGLAELSPETVACWAEVLHRVPAARLLLRQRELATPDAVAELVVRFGDFGIADRIELVDSVGAPLFAAARAVLLPLSLPRPGTVLAALEAGVPVVCPAGADRHRRFAASLLHHFGFGEEMIVADARHYVERALAWADCTDPAQRPSIAQRLREAPAGDARARARDLQTVIETMWRSSVSRLAIPAESRAWVLA